MELTVVPIVKPDAVNFIFGQSHFIKTVEDLHEALVARFPAFASGWPSARPLVSGWCAGQVMTKPPSPSHVTTHWPSAPATLF
jgi:hypothetical protein